MLPTLLAREGFQAPGTEDFEWPAIWEIHLGGFTLEINRTALLMLLAMLVVLALFLVAFRRPKVVPRGLQNLMEVGVEFVRRQIILEVIGQDGLRFLPYLATLFFFIFFANVLEIVPGINFPATSRMALPLFLAILTWVLFNWVGIRAQGPGRYLRNTLFPPGIPWPLYILIAPIEFVSTLIVRPVTLSVRLLANMIAGHLILAVFFLGTVYLIERPATAVFAVPAFAMAVALVGFELVVALLQAYIFTILTAVYLAGALEPEH
ncbi:MAG TPA: F0F1 ATP synthase subunit A [Actinomycetes bacterium]|jgi:F-type H+-transporting ATPase subunit a|nr:F0F1 ATP synthase subunit A [Actinomycetes bacterium]